MNATDFACPVCGANPGERCHTLTGKWLPVTHARRKWAALDALPNDEASRSAGDREQQAAKE